MDKWGVVDFDLGVSGGRRLFRMVGGLWELRFRFRFRFLWDGG